MLVFQLEAEVPGVKLDGTLHMGRLVADTMQSLDRTVVPPSLIGNPSGVLAYRGHCESSMVWPGAVTYEASSSPPRSTKPTETLKGRAARPCDNGRALASSLAMKSTRAKVSALLKESRKSLKDLRRIYKKLRALRAHVEGPGKKPSKKAKR
jgi:hypothetical protein